MTVLIIGAGPTGLTLACDLARRGVSFCVIETSAGPQMGSRGKGLQPRSLEYLDNLGIAERVMAQGRMGMPMRLVGRDGRSTDVAPSSSESRPDIPYLTSLITPQWHVEETLRQRLSELGGAVWFDTSLSDIEQTDAIVSATIIKGDLRHQVRAEWVVGCDGGHSAARRLAAIPFDGETRPDVRMIVADVSVEGLDCGTWRVWRHVEGFLALCPLPSTSLFQYQASIAPGQVADLTRSNLQTTLERRTGRTDLVIGEPSWSSLWRANVRLAARYREGRVLLAGDAAHVHSPAGGQGMNTGIQDAANLGWKLAAIAKGAPFALINTYEAERRPVAMGVLALSNARLDQAIAGKSIPTQSDAKTLQLDLNYRGSPLARDDRAEGATLRAGDRAPDATHLITTSGPRRLFDLLRGGNFTVLAFGDVPKVESTVFPINVFRAALAIVDDRDFIDASGHLAAAYMPGPASLVVIRPDGYIGMISDGGDPTALREYFASME